MKKFLHGTLKKLNKIELTMEFGQTNTHISHNLNNILNKRFLVLEICLKLKDALVAVVILVTITLLAFSAKGQLKKATLGENGFNSLWLIQEIRVVAQEDYWLRNSLTIAQEPPVAHVSLLSARLNIHS
jgi:hypothetical protein